MWRFDWGGWLNCNARIFEPRGERAHIVRTPIKSFRFRRRQRRDRIPIRLREMASMRSLLVVRKSVLQIHIMLCAERLQRWVKLRQTAAFSIARR